MRKGERERGGWYTYLPWFLFYLLSYIDDPLAYISLAHCYTLGKGVEISMEKAFENYFEASKSSV